MFKPKNMTKLSLIAPKSYQAGVIRKLHSMGVLHIIEHSKSQELDIGRPLSTSVQLSESLVKIRSILGLFKSKEFVVAERKMIAELKDKDSKQHTKSKFKAEDFTLASVSVEATKLHDEISATLNSYRETEAEIKRNKNLLSKSTVLKKLELNLNALKPYETLSHLIGYMDKPQEFATKIRAETSKVYIKTGVVENKNIIAIFFGNEERQKIMGVLEKYRFQAIDLSELELELSKKKDTDSISVKSLQEHIKTLEEKSAKQMEKMALYSKKHNEYLTEAEKFLLVETEKAEAPLKFASTEETFIVSGWIPSEKSDYVVSELKRVTKDKLYVETRQATHHDRIPIELDNPKAVKPFEMLMHLYTLPKFHEIDPTFFIFLSFPFFFGFMLGDFGYGLVTLILFMVLKKFIPKAKGFFNILIFASIMTIVFGLMFGEFFGYEQIGSYHLPYLLHRSTQIMDLLAWAIVIGVAHLNIGLLIGFFNVKSHHGAWKAFCEKISWMILQAGVFAGVAIYKLDYILVSNAKTTAFIIGGGLIVIAIILLWLGEGVKGVIELPSIFSNMLSYARLMALGVAGVKLAEVINEFAGEFFHMGGMGYLWGVLLLIVGHLINIALGIMGPFLHSLRLHYVEFFTKFFEGGGMTYTPFGQKEDTD